MAGHDARCGIVAGRGREASGRDSHASRGTGDGPRDGNRIRSQTSSGATKPQFFFFSFALGVLPEQGRIPRGSREAGGREERNLERRRRNDRSR